HRRRHLQRGQRHADSPRQHGPRQLRQPWRRRLQPRRFVPLRKPHRRPLRRLKRGSRRFTPNKNLVEGDIPMNRKRTLTRRLAVELLEDRSLLSTGFLDPTFAGDGIVTTNVGLAEWGEQPWDVAAYPGSSPGADGKIVVVGDAVTRMRSGGF